ncbi:hypothetical protein [Secundilactobacillus collinoides]|uniref:hypothetical protein n=1 Tax=Secundilactobacillus collinoides TaxID=33960 RepID=UPI000A8DB418|nr:hypothetical protein [Secundilactobacillus collinoides]
MAKRHILIVSCQSAKQLIASDEDHFAQRSASHYDRWLDSVVLAVVVNITRKAPIKQPR